VTEKSHVPAGVVESADSEEARRRVRRVFGFLRAFSERRAPTARTLAEVSRKLRLADLPNHPTVKLGAVSLRPIPIGTAASKLQTQAGDDDDDPRAAEPLLRVRRPVLTKAPPPPEALGDWIQKGWERPDGKIAVWSVRNRRTRGAKLVAERFADEPAPARALTSWTRVWKSWAESERPAREAMRVFETLYALHGDIEREGERIELLLGDGRLTVRGPEGRVDHPVLLQRVDLVFDPDVPEFRVVDSDRAPELYSPALLAVGTLPGEKLNELQGELETGGFHPLAGEETSGFLRRLVSLLGPAGQLHESMEDAEDAAFALLARDAGDARDASAPEPPGAPVIVREAWLLVRDRAAGFGAAFDRVLEDLDRGGVVPTALQRIVGISAGAAAATDASSDVTSFGSIDPGDDGERASLFDPPALAAEDLLLSKPANAEQIAIVRALGRHKAVLVQGPPGTGKSHTIANLVGHLVAQGKRVLVTSYTTKALRVLRDQIVEELRPLCVSVLDNDLEGRTQMEHAVRGIVHRLSSTTDDQLSGDLATLTRTRAELAADVARINAALAAVRESEYLPITTGAESVSPADATRQVEATSHLHGWLPGPIPQAAPVPLTETELQELYASNDEVSADAEQELGRPLPTRADVLAPDVVSDEIARIESSRRSENGRYFAATPEPGDLAALDTLERSLDRLLRDIVALGPWQQVLVAAGRAGGADVTAWKDLVEQVRQASDLWDAAQVQLLEHAPQIPAAPAPRDLIPILTELQDHTASGGSLGGLSLLMRSRWRSVLDSCRTNGRVPATPDEFTALIARAQVQARRQDLAARWDRQAAAVGLPAFASLDSASAAPEPALLEYVRSFDRLLVLWAQLFDPIQRQLETLGFSWDSFRADELARAAPSPPFARDLAILRGPLRAVLAERREAVGRLAALRRLKALADRLGDFDNPACRALGRAAGELDVHAYRREFTRLEDSWRKVEILQRRRALLRKLGAIAPEWSSAIDRRRGVHGALVPPRDLPAAWRWRQLQQELERRATTDDRALARRLEAQQAQLRDVTIDLVDRRAWLAQLRRTDLEARQALIGWADTQRKIGKGTGKRAPALQRRARELLTRAREAVPVWIMPLSRVAENFDPRQGRFDVVIVDEASQCDLLGMFALYLGDGAVIVGDHEQVSPSAIGESAEETSALVSQFLAGIPNSHLYDGQTSVYDLARQSFGETIGLREHFRCVPSIIGFSNHLSYGGQIRPLRDPDTARRPHTVEYPIPTAFSPDRLGKVNDAEARAVAALVAAAMSLPEYDGKTFGAISLLGDDQATRIQALIQQLVPLGDLERRRFVAGNPAQFQGDERDVVFLSMVDVPADQPLALQERASFKQRYNVASSRAKDQLWLVHSLDPRRDLQPTDLRRRLIEHVRDPAAEATVSAGRRRAPSPFEAEVVERLTRAGFVAETQVEVGGYRVDIVVSDGRHRVAIECDGDRAHAVERIAEEMTRQAVLERVGWRFIRLRATRFFRNPDAVMDSVASELRRLGIVPRARVGDRDDDTTGTVDGAAEHLRNKVIRRAWQILREVDWVDRPPSARGIEALPEALSDANAVPPPGVLGLAIGGDTGPVLAQTTGGENLTEELIFDDTTEPSYMILEQTEAPSDDSKPGVA
jgi:very-short-patch-repair endonuclease